MTLVSLIVVFIIITFLANQLMQYIKLWQTVNKLHGPSCLPIIGHLFQMKWDPADLLEQQAAFCYLYRNPNMWRMWLGPVPIIIVSGAEEAEAILSSNKHINKAYQYKFLEPWMGLGLLTSSSDRWRSRRKLLTPTFHSDILKDFVEVFNKEAKVLIKKLEATIGQGPMDYYWFLTLCALDIICESAMGKNVNAQHDQNSKYVKAVYAMNSIVHQRQKFPWLWPEFMFRTIGRGVEHQQNLEILHGFSEKVIQERYAALSSNHNDIASNGASDKTRKRLAFLDLLVEMAVHDQISLEDVRSEVDTFMAEGHDTTTAGMNWALFLLGCNPEIQAKVHQELDRVFGGSDRDITFEDLKNLEYLERCVKESLRLFPSVPIFARRIDVNTELAKYEIPKGATVLVIPYAVHRDERHWPDPEIFDPDRFLPENTARRHPFAYIPFSAGPRNCIGQRFALLEEKTVLASILRKFTVRSCQRRDHVRPKEELILRSDEPMKWELFLR